VLVEYFDEEFPARVFSELVKLQQLARPAPMTPPLRQWRAMVPACNGILATTRFGFVVEDFVQLNSPDFKGIPQSTHAIPQSIAKALHAVGFMSSGQEKQLTIIGGQDAAGIAAIAEWLFDFKVVVQGQDGTRLYTNCDNLEPEVLIAFNYNMEADGPFGSMQTKGSLHGLILGAEPEPIPAHHLAGASSGISLQRYLVKGSQGLPARTALKRLDWQLEVLTGLSKAWSSANRKWARLLILLLCARCKALDHMTLAWWRRLQTG
jgi:hypothetical protein